MKAVLVLSVLALAGCASPAVSADDAAGGQAVYNQTCVACHGSDGKGAIPGTPDFTRADGPLAQSDEVLFDHIANGFQSPGSPMAMPPKGGNADLTEDQIRQVMTYLRQRFQAQGKAD